jgi:hypothetical protein
MGLLTVKVDNRVFDISLAVTQNHILDLPLKLSILFIIEFVAENQDDESLTNINKLLKEFLFGQKVQRVKVFFDLFVRH